MCPTSGINSTTFLITSCRTESANSSSIGISDLYLVITSMLLFNSRILPAAPEGHRFTYPRWPDPFNNGITAASQQTTHTWSSDQLFCVPAPPAASVHCVTGWKKTGLMTLLALSKRPAGRSSSLLPGRKGWVYYFLPHKSECSVSFWLQGKRKK